jgi:hypothetical protein
MPVVVTEVFHYFAQSLALHSSFSLIPPFGAMHVLWCATGRWHEQVQTVLELRATIFN